MVERTAELRVRWRQSEEPAAAINLRPTPIHSTPTDRDSSEEREEEKKRGGGGVGEKEERSGVEWSRVTEVG